MRILELSNHPGTTCHPSNGGELATYRRGIKFPSAEGWCALRDGVVYSIAQACSNTYEPVLSLYVVFAGAYIMHEPPGLDMIQLVAVPIDVWSDGHAASAMVM